MSIRHYTPRRRARGGASPILIKVMAASLALTIFMQILYPLVDGGLLGVITIASVYTAALAMFLHCCFWCTVCLDDAFDYFVIWILHRTYWRNN